MSNLFRRMHVQKADLTNANKNEINDLKREEELLRQKQESLSNLRNTKADIYISEMEAEEKELIAKNKKMRQEIKNIDIESENAEAEARRDFIRILNTNKTNQIKNDHEKGAYFLEGSYQNNKTSTITSIAGMIVPNIAIIYEYYINKNWADFAQTIGVIAICIYSFWKMAKFLNKQIVDLPNVIAKYVDFQKKKSTQYITLIGCIIGILITIICSVWTNAMLWTSLGSMFKLPVICVVIYSFIYDYNSVLYSFLGFIHSEQLYKEEYKNELIIKKMHKNNSENLSELHRPPIQIYDEDENIVNIQNYNSTNEKNITDFELEKKTI